MCEISASVWFYYEEIYYDARSHERKIPFSFVPNKIDELESNSQIKNIRHSCRCISDFKKEYQLRTNILKDEKGDLVIVCDSILRRWRKVSLRY
jgi:hypothetical protein